MEMGEGRGHRIEMQHLRSLETAGSGTSSKATYARALHWRAYYRSTSQKPHRTCRLRCRPAKGQRWTPWDCRCRCRPAPGSWIGGNLEWTGATPWYLNGKRTDTTAECPRPPWGSASHSWIVTDPSQTGWRFTDFWTWLMELPTAARTGEEDTGAGVRDGTGVSRLDVQVATVRAARREWRGNRGHWLRRRNELSPPSCWP